MTPLDDRGFTLGDGVFETVLADAGRLVAWSEHLARFARSAALLGLPPPPKNRVVEAACEALAASGLGSARAAVRITWTAGSGRRGLDRPDPLEPRLSAVAAAVPLPSGPARLHLVANVRRNEMSPASRAKTLNYLDNVLARKEARAASADEAVMLNTGGRLCCAAAANLYWIKDDRLFTPALDCGVLCGIVRLQVLGAARKLGVEAVETTALPEALRTAEAVLISNSLIGLREAFFGPAPASHALGRVLSAEVARIRECSSCS